MPLSDSEQHESAVALHRVVEKFDITLPPNAPCFCGYRDKKIMEVDDGADLNGMSMVDSAAVEGSMREKSMAGRLVRSDL